MDTFDLYLKSSCSLTFDEMQTLHNEMMSEIGSDPEAVDFYGELVAVATRYASFRASWKQMSLEEQADTDPNRTSCHNSLITHLNMLCRYLRMQGKKADWRDKLGYEEDNAYNRKKIGDFGCYIVFVNSLCAR